MLPARSGFGPGQEGREELGDGPPAASKTKPLTIASYAAGDDVTAYVDSVSVGDVLPPAPVFLQFERYVPVPLAETYESTWAELPIPVRELFGT